MAKQENLVYADPDTLGDLTDQEKKNVKVVQTELQGWCEQDVDKVLSAMAEDGTYWDITMEPSVGHDAVREFGDGWVTFCPNFSVFVEKFIIQGDWVVNMGRIYGDPVPGMELFPGQKVKE